VAGLDLRFPHHENEMAQSQAAGDDFANFWMHNGMVTFEGEKMSKSIGNTVSPAEMLELASPRVVRYYLGQAHYRSILDYRPTSLQEAAAAVERIDGFITRPSAKVTHGRRRFPRTANMPAAFIAAMDDDLNVPQALGVLHETVRAGNTALASGDLEGARQALYSVTVHDRGPRPHSVKRPEAVQGREHAALEVLIEAQLEARAAARASKDWAASDAIRDTLPPPASSSKMVRTAPPGASNATDKRALGRIAFEGQ
jgi:cysteinyl-tRNA synthetase